MERRHFLGQAGAAALATFAGGQVLAQAAKPAAGHQHHHASPKAELLIDALTDCINKGEACLAHCLILMGDGDKSVAGCATSVSEMIALCEGLRKLAAQGSKRAVELARIAKGACLDCEKECRKHETKHAECRACAKSCADCAKECEKFAA